MTSIEWLRQELHSFIMGNSKLGYDEIIIQAKEMHKQEIETAYEEGYNRAAKVIEDAVQRTILKDKL